MWHVGHEPMTLAGNEKNEKKRDEMSGIRTHNLSGSKEERRKMKRKGL